MRASSSLGVLEEARDDVRAICEALTRADRTVFSLYAKFVDSARLFMEGSLLAHRHIQSSGVTLEFKNEGWTKSLVEFASAFSEDLEDNDSYSDLNS